MALKAIVVPGEQAMTLLYLLNRVDQLSDGQKARLGITNKRRPQVTRIDPDEFAAIREGIREQIAEQIQV